MRDTLHRRSVVGLLAATLTGGCAGLDGDATTTDGSPTDRASPTRTSRHSTAAPPTDRTTTERPTDTTPTRTPPPTGSADLSGLELTNRADERLVVTITITPTEGTPFSQTVVLDADELRPVETTATLDRLDQPGTLRATVESSGATATYDLPESKLLWVVVTTDGVSFTPVVA